MSTPSLTSSPHRSSVSSTASLSSNTALPKTTIIINNLHKNDFIVNPEPGHADFSPNFKKLSLADQIKITVLNLEPEHEQPLDTDDTADYYLNHIEHWSNLAFLNRIIIILKDEHSAINIYKYLTSDAETSLTSLFPYIKVSLQENLLSRSKSVDALVKGNNDNLNVSKSLANFKERCNNTDGDKEYDYNEPEPQQFDVLKDLSKLGIDLTDYNNDAQINELKQPSPTPVPVGGISRSRSLTKTLFKPELKLNLDDVKKSDVSPVYPASPTITLDETF
ncbi:uncharacterized protein RJT20DRAFT_136589 [Scheffersomyces xylosifermentans]|uniref:uncharacterized protein n=1 Tax=Scheffersomyces xylosifermentans TaxID=1304137 RepID=UPI00315CBA98